MRRRAAQLAGLAGGVILSTLLAGSYPAVPLSMTCAEFSALGETEQLRVMAWMDGYARKRLRPVAARERDRLAQGCRQWSDDRVRDHLAR